MIYDNYSWLLALGFVPYIITRNHLSGGLRRLEIQALFWSLELQQRPSGRHNWKVRVPLILRLRDIIWAILSQFKPNDPQPDESASEEKEEQKKL